MNQLYIARLTGQSPYLLVLVRRGAPGRIRTCDTRFRKSCFIDPYACYQRLQFVQRRIRVVLRHDSSSFRTTIRTTPIWPAPLGSSISVALPAGRGTHLQVRSGVTVVWALWSASVGMPAWFADRWEGNDCGRDIQLCRR